MLEIRGLDSYYGRAQILDRVDLDVGAGEAVALLGRNGAGKSTLLKCIVGLVRERRGAIRFRAADLLGLPTHRVSRLGVGYVPEERRIFSNLTVRENLEVGRRPRQRTRWPLERILEVFPNLAGMMDRSAGAMSGGEQQMLTVARTLMGNPFLVLLDEPSEGVAPVIVEQMANTIIELKKEGLSILLSEQNVHFARLVSDRVYVLEKGQIRWSGTMPELEDNVEVQRAYLTV